MFSFFIFAASTATPLHRAANRNSAEAYALSLSHSRAPCPCQDTSLCKPIGGPHIAEREIFGFNGGNGSLLDFSRVTSVAWPSDPQLICAAHKGPKPAKVIMAAPQPEKVFLENATVRAAWVAKTVAAVQNGYLDGITFDWESPCDAGAPSQAAYATLIAQTNKALKEVSPSYQVSVCVAWSPDGIDGRNYNIPAFAKAADLLYVMDYDTRSQIFDACIAAANAPLPGMIHGLQRYFDLGVPPSQLVLGVPWYGYRYPCVEGTDAKARYCPIPFRPFRGVNCSDAAGSEVGVSVIMQRLKANSTTGRLWDKSQGAPFFNTVENGGTVQYWYDDVSSLTPKYDYAKQAGVRGVGPYSFGNVNLLDARARSGFYEAFDAFLVG